jgi:hypothetical protein
MCLADGEPVFWFLLQQVLDEVYAGGLALGPAGIREGGLRCQRALDDLQLRLAIERETCGGGGGGMGFVPQ